MDKERAMEVLIGETLKEYVGYFTENKEIPDEEKTTLRSLIRVIEYVSLHHDFKKYMDQHKDLIDVSLGNKNVPSNSLNVTCLEENEDGSANIEFEMGADTKSKVIEEGINFILLKTALSGDTEQILKWAQRGKQEENTDDIMKRFNAARAAASDEY